MKTSFTLLLWWALFAWSHVLMSSARFRPKLIARLGARPFQVVYSVVAFVTLYFLIDAYAEHKHAGWQLWIRFGPDLLARDLNVALMMLAFVLLIGGLAARPPSGMIPGGSLEPYGMIRITRHPVFAAIFLFGVAHSLVNGTIGDLIFFGGFAVFSWVGAWHQDTRKVLEIPGYAEFKAATSFIPFAAILGGKQPFPRHEVRWGMIILALVVFYIIRTYHPSLFGGSILMTV